MNVCINQYTFTCILSINDLIVKLGSQQILIFGWVSMKTDQVENMAP